MQQLELDQIATGPPSLGKEEAFNACYRQYGSRIRAEIHHSTAGLKPEDQEDIEQEVWKAVWRGLPRFRQRSTLATWLISVARHVIFSWLRRKRSREAGQCRLLERGVFEGSLDSWSGIDPVLRHLSLEEDLHNVDVRYAVVLRLRYFEQLTDTDVAQRLELPLGTVKGRIRTGLKKLRGVLSHEDQIMPADALATDFPTTRMPPTREENGVRQWNGFRNAPLPRG